MSRTDAAFVVRRMPPKYHILPGEEFDIMKREIPMIQFFLPMAPPTVTLQEHRIGINRKGAPYVYDPPELKVARSKFTAALERARGQHGPAKRLTGPVRLTTRWCWPVTDARHRHGEYKTSRPDTDNLVKLFKDCMTRVGFWRDDAQVVSELTEKFWTTETPGVFVRVEPLP